MSDFLSTGTLPDEYQQLAKTVRDAQMEQLDARYPGFNLAGHKGYPTPHHLRCLEQLGPSPLHRASFAPVRLARR